MRFSQSKGPNPFDTTQVLFPLLKSFSTSASLSPLLCLGMFWFGGVFGVVVFGWLGVFLRKGDSRDFQTCYKRLQFEVHMTPRE